MFIDFYFWLKLTKTEFEIFKNLTSKNYERINTGLRDLRHLDTFNLVPYLDGLEKKLPQARNDPRELGIKWRSNVYFKLHKHLANGGKCNCIFFERYGVYFFPDTNWEGKNLQLIGVGDIDISNFIDEKLYKCKNCSRIWAVNINYGGHFPVAEWREI